MHKLHCRPGDLAVAVDAVNAENVGAMVEVLRLADATTHPLAGEPGALWWVRAVGRPMAYRFPNGAVLHLAEGPVPDRCLRPIRGRDDDAPAAVPAARTLHPQPEYAR
ncbi:MAG: hypothetical protein AMXMBFR66_04330 [Pseudomonadota bacterium]|nr:hypothetical protein [Rubrivivax sp.]NLZ40122.1 hypothetical protein [Comamonadaceae bacterium]